MSDSDWLKEAGEQLRKLIHEHGTQGDFAKKVDVAQQTVSAWCRGVLVPGPMQRVLIKRLTGMPSWL